jgi:hypothetical protein
VEHGWEKIGQGVRKNPGSSSSLACFAPVIAGEKYLVTLTLSDVISGGVHPGAGAGPLQAFLSTNGDHVCEIVAGSDNARFGLLASADFSGVVLRLNAELSH